MKKIMLVGVLALVFVGCGEHSSSSGDYAGMPTNTTVYSGGGDVSINQTTVADNGVYIQNADGTVTYTTGNGNSFDTGDNGTSGDYPGEDAPADECRAAGYFFCTISQSCLNQPSDGGACTSSR